MKKTVEISSKELRTFIKRCGICVSGDAQILVTLSKIPRAGLSAVFGAVQAPDGTSRVSTMTQLEKDIEAPDGRYMGFIASARDFLALAEMQAALADKVLIVEEDGEIRLETEAPSEVKIETMSGVVGQMITPEQEFKAALKIKKGTAIRLFRDGVKSVSDQIDHPAGIGHAVLHIGEDGLFVASTNGQVMSYASAAEGEYELEDAAGFDKAVEQYQASAKVTTRAIEIGLPYQMASFMVSALSATDQEEVILKVDSKFMHLIYDVNAILSCAQASTTAQLKPVLDVFLHNADSVKRVVVDKDVFVKSMSVPSRVRKLGGDKLKQMGMRMEERPGEGVVLSLGSNCKVVVPVVGSSGEGEVDIYLYMEYLANIAGSLPAGNLLIEVVAMPGGGGAIFSQGSAEGRPESGNFIAVAGMVYDYQKDLAEKYSAGILGETDEAEDSEAETDTADGDAEQEA